MSTANKRPKGENSPNLVTLLGFYFVVDTFCVNFLSIFCQFLLITFFCDKNSKEWFSLLSGKSNVFLTGKVSSFSADQGDRISVIFFSHRANVFLGQFF
jgi:hypothetical protein